MRLRERDGLCVCVRAQKVCDGFISLNIVTIYFRKLETPLIPYVCVRVYVFHPLHVYIK